MLFVKLVNTSDENIYAAVIGAEGFPTLFLIRKIRARKNFGNLGNNLPPSPEKKNHQKSREKSREPLDWDIIFNYMCDVAFTFYLNEAMLITQS